MWCHFNQMIILFDLNKYSHYPYLIIIFYSIKYFLFRIFQFDFLFVFNIVTYIYRNTYNNNNIIGYHKTSILEYNLLITFLDSERSKKRIDFIMMWLFYVCT